MKSFHDIRLTAAVGSDAECEVAFRTDVVRTKGGTEYRNGLSGQPRHGYRWSVARASTELEDLKQFHGARKGSKYAFRFRDPFDNTLPLTVISTGSTGTEFNIVKRYAAGGSTFERRILLPDTSQTTVYVGTTALASTAWNITTAYQLHLNVSPGAGKTVSVQGVYDVPVRFDSGFAARLSSPDADEVEVELTEARYSPPVTFSTGSTWSPQGCNVFDNSQYFFDTFNGSALSTDWSKGFIQWDEWPKDPRQVLAATTASHIQQTTVSGGFYTVSSYVNVRYSVLCLKMAFHPPVRVRQMVHISPNSGFGGYLSYCVTLDNKPSTGAESSGVSALFTWTTSWENAAAGQGAIHISAPYYATYVTGPHATHSVPFVSTAFTPIYMTMDFSTSGSTFSIFPSTGGVFTVNSTIKALSSTCYVKIISWCPHSYKLDWLDVKSA